MLPAVTAGIANSRTTLPREASSIHSSVDTESFTGTVFGIATTLVNPPAAAAAVPVAIDLLVGLPGLPQMHMHIHQPRRDNASAHIDL